MTKDGEEQKPRDRAAIDKKSAVDILVEEGIARDEAERLVEGHGTNWETLKALAWTKRAPASEPGEP